MEDNKTKNEKWKKILLIIAAIFQILQIMEVLLSVVFRKNILFGEELFWGKNVDKNEYISIIPFRAISSSILYLIMFFICCFLLTKKDNSNNSIIKEIITIVLTMPIYYILNRVLESGFMIFYTSNFTKYSLNYSLDAYISVVQNLFLYCSFSILAIVAAILIGKKKSKSDR